MIDLIAAAGIGGIIGFGTCAVLTMGKVADAQSDDGPYVDWQGACIENIEIAAELKSAHTRCSDALETARNRIERALAVETPKAAHGVKKMARLLRGEQGA